MRHVPAGDGVCGPVDEFERDGGALQRAHPPFSMDPSLGHVTDEQRQGGKALVVRQQPPCAVDEVVVGLGLGPEDPPQATGESGPRGEAGNERSQGREEKPLHDERPVSFREEAAVCESQSAHPGASAWFTRAAFPKRKPWRSTPRSAPPMCPNVSPFRCP